MELARQQQNVKRRTVAFAEPQTAGPTATSFVTRRASQAEHLKAQLHLSSKTSFDEQVPMTASLGGKFGGRLNPNASTFRMGNYAEVFPEADETFQIARTGNSAPVNTPVTPNSTTVISGGTSLGLSNGSIGTINPTNSGMAPSKSDTSLNWRRGGNNNILNNNRAVSVNVKVTPPPGEYSAPSPARSHRPEPLRFSVIINEPTNTVAVEGSDGEAYDDVDDTSSSSSAKSEPTTPPSGSSDGSAGLPPLSPREVATKRLYEGLGLGRPSPQSASVQNTSFSGSNGLSLNVPYTSAGMTFPNRVVSQPLRQPRGPPSGVDELGPRNFASRIRRKAIGGLGAMLDARVNRKEVETF